MLLIRKRIIASALAVMTTVCLLSSCSAGWEDLESVGTGSGDSAPSSEPQDQTGSAGNGTDSSSAEGSTIQTGGKPEINPDDWNLILVNPSHPLEEITRDNLVELTVTQKSNGNGKYFDKRAAEYVAQMFEAAKEEGINLLSRSTFRTYNKQKTYFDSHVNGFMAQGMTEDEAKEKTLDYTAAPGTSEHHTGLAIDITTSEWEADGKGLNDSFAETDAAKWLKENAHKYGFILRYPKEKESITKIKYEPWHFRYVGVEHATEIYSRGICLEEYLGELD